MPAGGKREGAGRKRERDRDAVVTAICIELEKGILSLNQILKAMEPPLSRWTLVEWRKEDPDLNRMIDEAFELGSDNMASRMRLTAQGKKPHEGGDSTGSVDRDKLVLWWDEKLIAIRNTRYNRSTKLANDPDNPLTKPASRLSDEELLRIAGQAARTNEPKVDG